MRGVLIVDKLECVVLNACYSKVQAKAIAKYILYIIGMQQAIGDPNYGTETID